MNRNKIFLCNMFFGIVMLQSSTVLAQPMLPTKTDPTYEYVRSKEDVKKLLDGVGMLKNGDSVQKVKETLGAPSLEDEMMGKKGEFVAYLLRYYIKCVSISLVNGHDEYVSIYFDKDKKLKKIEKMDFNTYLKLTSPAPR